MDEDLSDAERKEDKLMGMNETRQQTVYISVFWSEEMQEIQYT